MGEALFIAGAQGLLLKSSGAGAFEPLPSPYKGSFFGLLPTRAGALLAFGLRGHALRSDDGGASWQPLDSGTPLSLNAGLELPDGTLALLAQSGELLLSHDGGRSFTRRAGEGVPAAGLTVTTQGQLVLASLRGPRRSNP